MTKLFKTFQRIFSGQSSAAESLFSPLSNFSYWPFSWLASRLSKPEKPHERMNEITINVSAPFQEDAESVCILVNMSNFIREGECSYTIEQVFANTKVRFDGVPKHMLHIWETKARADKLPDSTSDRPEQPA